MAQRWLLGLGVVFMAWLPLADAAAGEGGCKAKVKSRARDELVLSFTFDRNDVLLGKDDGFDTVSLRDGVMPEDEPGTPWLPAVYANILLPADAEVQRVETAVVREVLVAGKARVWPAQPFLPAGDRRPTCVPPKEGAYRGKGKTQTVAPSTPATVDGMTYLPVRINPVRWVPDTGNLYLAEDLQVTVRLKRTGRKPRVHPRRFELFRQSVNSAVVNPNEPDSDPELAAAPAPAAVGELAPAGIADCLIITNNSLQAAFLPLENHREAHGLGTLITTTEYISTHFSGADLQAKIRNCIVNFRSATGTQYVLLGGDDTVVPARYCPVTYSSTSMNLPTDFYYADVNGNWDVDGDGIYGEPGEGDLGPDVYVGRVPVRTAAQVTAYVNKVIAFETNPPRTIARKFMMSGCHMGSSYSPPYYPYTGNDRPSDATSDGLRAFRDSAHPSVGDAEMWGRRAFRDRVQAYGWAGQVGALFDTLTSWDGATAGDYPASGSNMQTRFSEGWNYSINITHGGARMLVADGSAFATSNAAAMTGLTAVFYTTACDTGWFDNSYDPCLSEAMLRSSGGGALAYIGCSRYSWYSPDPPPAGSTTGGPGADFLREFLKVVFGPAYNPTRIGSAFYQHKFNLSAGAASNGTYRWIYFGLNLQGDPALSLMPFNEAPRAFGQTIAVSEDSAFPGTLTATDSDGDPLSYAIVTPPAHGAISGTRPNFVYTPNPDYAGADSFTFKANDGRADSNVATVTITVTAVPELEATPSPLAFTVYQGLIGSATLDVHNVGHGATDWTVVQKAPAEPNLSFSPTGGLIPLDGTEPITVSFDARAAAPGTYAATALISSPSHPEDPPVTVPVTVTVRSATEDTDGDHLPDSWEVNYFGNLAQNDQGEPDGDKARNWDEFIAGTDPTDKASVLRLSIGLVGGQIAVSFDTVALSEPWYGAGAKRYYRLGYTTNLVGNVWTTVPGCERIPATGERFQYVESDVPEVRYYKAWVWIEGGTPLTVSSITGTVTGNGQPLAGAVVQSLGAARTVTDAAGNYRLPVGQGDYGVYASVEGTGQSAPVAMTCPSGQMTADFAIDPPVIAPLAAREAAEGDALQVAVSASDRNGDPIVLSAAPLPAGASFTDNGNGTGTLAWTPDYDQAGSYQVTITASDGRYRSTAVLQVSVLNRNRAPELSWAFPDTPAVIVAGVPTTFGVSAHDPDGDELSYAWTIDDTPAGGAVETLVYTPAAADFGPHSMAVTISDGHGGTAVARWAVTVHLGVPGTPAASDGSYADAVRVSWGAVPCATHYKVLRAEQAGGARTEMTGWIAGTDFMDSSVTRNVRYYYSVQAATDAAGSWAGAPSAEDVGWAAEPGLRTEWEKTIGGGQWDQITDPLLKLNSQWDRMTDLQLTADGGCVLGGYSNSNAGRDKTEPSRGGYDYWVVKLDASGARQWDRRFGGAADDRLFSLQPTSDGGYILGGDSASGVGGDKSEASRGVTDYWVVKLDAAGNKQWDRTYGGSSGDQLTSVRQTSDGGYILGGISLSGADGDRTEPGRGVAGTSDYWIVKLDSAGDKQWDKRYGGAGNDMLWAVRQTADGGYLLGGYSGSDAGGDKSENNHNALGFPYAPLDFWIVKVDGAGTRQWDRTLGGDRDEYLKDLQVTADGGCVLGGYSMQADADYRVIKLNAAGAVQWDALYGGPGNTECLSGLQPTADGGYVLCGTNATGTWIVKVDDSGRRQWDRTYGAAWAGVPNPQAVRVRQTADGGLLVGGDRWDTTLTTAWDYWVMKLQIEPPAGASSSGTTAAPVSGGPVEVF